MYGQRLSVEEVGGTTDYLQLVDERPGSLLRCQVDSKDGSRHGAELRLRKFIERIVFHAGIVHPFNLRQLPALLRQPERGFRMTTEADVERIETERFSSIHTITTHRKNIFRKLGVNTAHEVIKYAFRAGLVDSSEFYI